MARKEDKDLPAAEANQSPRGRNSFRQDALTERRAAGAPTGTSRQRAERNALAAHLSPGAAPSASARAHHPFPYPFLCCAPPPLRAPPAPPAPLGGDDTPA